MPSSDFYECMLYDQMKPLPDRRGDIYFAAMMALVANIHRGPKQKAFSLTDFLLFDKVEKPRPTAAQQRVAFEAFVETYNQQFKQPN